MIQYFKNMALIVLLCALFICQAQSQICPGQIFPGPYGPCEPFIPNIAPPCSPILNNPCNNYINPVLPCQPEVVLPPVVSPCATVASPVVATTVVDNSLANSLANAIQLLIVSNLIENTLGSSNGGVLSSCFGVPETYEVIQDCYPAQIVYDTPCYDPLPIFEPPCFQEPYQPYEPCNFGYGVNEFAYGFDSCAPNFGNCAPNFGIDSCNCQFGSYIPPYSELSIPPVAVEVPFPSAIPAQLLCNFGYMPTTVPCVSVNVEPLPFDCGCNNPYGNIFY